MHSAFSDVWVLISGVFKLTSEKHCELTESDRLVLIRFLSRFWVKLCSVCNPGSSRLSVPNQGTKSLVRAILRYLATSSYLPLLAAYPPFEK